jgi:hypothetical protein
LADPLTSLLVRIAPKLVGLAWRAAWALFAGLLVAAALMPDHRWFLAIYIAPLLPTGAWWLSLRQHSWATAAPIRAWADVSAFVLGGLRVFGGWGVLPHSGHMLFLTYAVATTADLRFRAWAALLLVITTSYKLGLRHDWWSWSWGLGLGALAAVVWHAGRGRQPSVV